MAQQISELKRALMEGQGMSFAEATRVIREMKEAVRDGEDPEELLNEYGLEPDYILDLLE